MAILSGIDVLWYLSPRVILVRAPRTEIIVQDLHDTLREVECRQNNLIYDHLISTAGKEPLGGGVTVGLTSTLNNAILAFEARKTSVSSGLVTTTDSAGVYLIDSNASFIADGVKVGAYIVNETDQSTCTVLNIIDGYTLLTDVLGDGYTNTFTFGDDYKIWNVTQCTVSGGNLVAKDSGGNDISPILPTVGTQVRTTASSSATLQELQDIQFASFEGGVTVDVINGTDGITYPIGTKRIPVNNLVDALYIAHTRGFDKLYIKGDITIDSGLDYSGLIFVGESMTRSLITVSPAANVFGCEFFDAEVTGTLDGGSVIRNCLINQLNYIDGVVQECLFGENALITLSGVLQATFLDCWGNAADEDLMPIIDCDGVGTTLVVRNYAGTLAIQNKTGPEFASISLSNGHIKLASTVTNGVIEVSGTGHLEDLSTGTTIVDEHALINTAKLAIQLTESTSSLKYLITSDLLHGDFGTAFYWDPVNGDDGYTGTQPDSPRKTFANIHDNLVTSGANDVIFVIGAPVITERITLSKNNLALRGTGGAYFVPADDGGPTITVTGVGNTVRGFGVTVKPGTLLTVKGVYVTGTNFLLRSCEVTGCTGGGVYITGGQYNQLYEVSTRANDGYGLHIVDSAAPIIRNCIVANNTAGGIVLENNVGLTVGAILDNSSIKWNGSFDLYVGAGTLATIVKNNCDIDNDSIINNSFVYFNSEERRKEDVVAGVRRSILPLYSKL